MNLTGNTRIAGIIGWPVGHSLSPRLHGYWLEHHRIDGVYVPFPVLPDQLAVAVRGLVAAGVRGFNVTVPHKEHILPLLDQVVPAAVRMGAVNTVVVLPDGKTEGRNTDAYGFLQNLHGAKVGFDPAAGPAVIIGAGGAARAAIGALLEAGTPELRVLNRTPDRALVLAQQFGTKVLALDWERRADVLGDAALLVNTTTQGMKGHPALDLRLDRLAPTALVTDAVYVPLETPLLAEARARGNRTVDGLGMLLHQARAGFQAWFGVDPEVSPALRQFVMAGLAA